MIKLKDDYYVLGDEKCYQLVKRCKDDKKGQKQYNIIGYYSTIEETINGLVRYLTRRFISSTEQQTLNDLIKFQKDLGAEIKSNLIELKD